MTTMKEYKMVTGIHTSITKAIEETAAELADMVVALEETHHVDIVSHDILETTWREEGVLQSGYLVTMLVKIEAR